MRVPLLPRPVRLVGAVAVAVAVLAASVAPPSDGTAALGPFGLVGRDKWLHVAAYGALAAAVAYALPARSRRRLALAVGLAAGFGLVVEAIQFGLPYRSFDLADAAVNGVGALLAAVAWQVLGIGRRLYPLAGDDGQGRPE